MSGVVTRTISDVLDLVETGSDQQGRALGTLTITESVPDPPGPSSYSWTWISGKHGLGSGDFMWQTTPNWNMTTDRLAIKFENAVMRGFVYCDRYVHSKKIPPDRPWFKAGDDISGYVCYGSQDPKRAVDCSNSVSFTAKVK